MADAAEPVNGDKAKIRAELAAKRAEVARLKEEIEKLEASRAARRALSEVLKVFQADLDAAVEVEEPDPEPSWGRTVVRSLFAALEGVCYQLKQLAMAEAAVMHIALSNAELAALREESYRLNDEGDAETVKAKLGTAQNLVFSLKIVARSEGKAYTLDKGSKGWNAFKKSIRVRDRITHPKSASDLDVSVDEAHTMLLATAWFLVEAKKVVGRQRGPEPAV